MSARRSFAAAAGSQKNQARAVDTVPSSSTGSIDRKITRGMKQ